MNRFEKQRGFSLIELVVASLVLSVAMLLTAQILRDSHRFARLAQDDLLRPDAGIATVRLRADIRGATGFRSRRPRAREGQPSQVTNPWLELRGAVDRGRGTVSYRLERDQLVRTIKDRAGREIQRDVVLGGVRSFRWRRLSARLLEVEIEAGPVGRRSGPGSREVMVTTALRNTPLSQW